MLIFCMLFFTGLYEHTPHIRYIRTFPFLWQKGNGFFVSPTTLINAGCLPRSDYGRCHRKAMSAPMVNK